MKYFYRAMFIDNIFINTLCIKSDKSQPNKVYNLC